MSKFGVGVGDDFPVDDGNSNAANEPPRDDREDYEEWKRRREAHRAQREQWSAQREQWRAQREEWRDRKHDFKEKVRAAARENFGPRAGEHERGHYYGWRFGARRHRFPFFILPALGLLIPILVIALLIALIAAIFKSPFLFLALILGAFLFFGFRGHHWFGHRHGWHDRHDHDRHGPGRQSRRDRHDRDYDVELKPTPQPPQPTVVVTPPPQNPSAPQDGGK